MSGLTWLHLSDWHQQSGKDFDRERLLDPLLQDVRDRAKISPDLAELDFIVFTGDVAKMAGQQEYARATEIFFKPLLRAAGFGEDGWDRLFVVPGNHDIDWEKVSALPENVGGLLTKREVVNSLLENDETRTSLLSTFDVYAQFVRQNWRAAADGGFEPAYYYVREFEKNLGKGKKRIAVIGLNSAWLSARNRISKDKVNDYGYLALGEPQVHRALGQAREADIRIAIMHHPFSWLSEFDRDVVEELLYENCHFILHGHTHRPMVNVIASTLGETINIPAGSTFSHRREADPRYINAYNFVHLDFDTGLGTAYLRRWNELRGGRWDKDYANYTDGHYIFLLPKEPGVTHNERLVKGMMSRFRSRASRRGFKDYEINIRHTLVDFDGVKLLRQEMRHRSTMVQGPVSKFKQTSFLDERAAYLIKTRNLPVKPYEMNYFKVCGRDVQGRANGDQVIYEAEIPAETAEIEYQYTVYYKSECPYLFQLGLYCEHFRLTLLEDEGLAYEYRPLGGFPTPQPARDDLTNLKFIETKQFSFPDQGCVFYWYPKESD